MPGYADVSIVLPAKNEADGLAILLPKLLEITDGAEIIVVDDGSADRTVEVCRDNNIKVISHPYSLGNGASIKTGARNATRKIIVFMDSDGQHRPEDLPGLIKKLEEGYKMVVGARTMTSQASLQRGVANYFYNKLASFMTGYEIKDLTSGFRAVEAQYFKRFLYLLPNGFSYPTTITMAFFRSGLPVTYMPIINNPREGKSHLNIISDGIRFLVIILKIGALFSPMRLFLPVSVTVFITGLSYYLYTYFTIGRFTNMSALLLLSSLIIFLMGILSELVSSLHYKDHE